MANRVKELVKLRKMASKSFLLDNGKISSDCISGPVHYRNTIGELKDIVLAYNDDDTQHIATEHYMSNGYRKDLKHNKMWGLRYRTRADNQGANYQYEMSPDSVEINGSEQLSGLSFSSMNVQGNITEHVISSSISYFHELRWNGMIGYVKIDTAPVDFKILEEIHLKGFYCTNTLVGDEYTADARGRFNFARKDNDVFAFAIRTPLMWDEKAESEIDQVSFGVQHKLYHVAGPKLIYEKTATSEGLTWLTSAVGAVSIDTSTDFAGTTSDGRIASGSGPNFATQRALATGTSVNDTSVTVNVSSVFSSPNYSFWHSFLFFITTAVGTDNVDSADLFLRVVTTAGADDIIAQLGTQGDPLATTDFGAFVSLNGDSYGKGVNGVAGTVTQITFGANGRADINGAGTTKIALRNSDFDFDNVAPVGNNLVQYSSQNVGTPSFRPKLTVVHTPAVSGRPSNFMIM